MKKQIKNDYWWIEKKLIAFIWFGVSFLEEFKGSTFILE